MELLFLVGFGLEGGEKLTTLGRSSPSEMETTEEKKSKLIVIIKYL